MPTKKTRPTAKSADDDQRRASLTSILGTILRELNELTPPDIVTVPIALNLDLARLLQEHIAHIERTNPPGLPDHDHLTTGVHNYYLAHGFYHAALEADPPQPALAQRIARVILASADPITQARFTANHPQAATAAAQHNKEPRA